MPIDGNVLKHQGGQAMDCPESSQKSPPDMSLPMNVPAEKLLELLKTSNEMMENTFLNDHRAMLRTVVRHISSLLEVEACGIFLVPNDRSEELVLEASYSDKWHHEFPPVQLKIQSVPKGGLTGHIAAQGEVVRLHGESLLNTPYSARNPPEHLASGKSYSLLGVPLKDRKGRVLGVMKVDNKKDVDGKPNETICFTEVDESIAIILANHLVVALENILMPKLFARLTQDLHTAQDLAEAFKTILHTALELFRADRAEIVLWNESKHDLVVAAHSGESVLEIGQVIPTPSLIRTLWNSPSQSLLVPDVSVEPSYYAANPRTRSEIAIRLELKKQPLGVLNVESSQLNGFDHQDLEVLQVLAQHAAIAIQVIGREMSFHGIVQRLVERPLAYDELLKSILESVRDIYGLDSGIIYIADDVNHVLRCSAFISEKPLAAHDLSQLSYHFDEGALATRVFHTGLGYFSPAPSQDSIVNQRDLQAFQIESPTVGVPLIFGEKVVGVLVAWSYRNPNLPSEGHITALEPFARLAAINIAISASEQQRTKVLQAIQGILAQMQNELSREKNLRLILHAV